jgi:hypothetical protein
MHKLFHLLLSEEAYIQYCELDMLLQLAHNSNKNEWNYIWGIGTYSSAKSPQTFTWFTTDIPSIQVALGSFCQLKHKIFFLALIAKQVEHEKIAKTQEHAIRFLYL